MAKKNVKIALNNHLVQILFKDVSALKTKNTAGDKMHKILQNYVNQNIYIFMTFLVESINGCLRHTHKN